MYGSLPSLVFQANLIFIPALMMNCCLSMVCWFRENLALENRREDSRGGVEETRREMNGSTS